MIVEKILRKTNDIVLDSSVLIAYFTDEKISIIPLLDEFVFNDKSSIILHGHNLLKSEIYYIACRKIDINEAKKVLENIEKVMNTISETWLFEKAGQIKCKYSIAISDCFSISLGIFKDCPIFFLKEQELSEDLVTKINDEFKTKIYVVS